MKSKSLDKLVSAVIKANPEASVEQIAQVLSEFGDLNDESKAVLNDTKDTSKEEFGDLKND